MSYIHLCGNWYNSPTSASKKMVYALELDQGVYQEGQACVEF